MERAVSQFLNEWLTSPHRKPLVMRGARQVGKTWLIRRLAENAGKKLIEINFEKYPSLINSIFKSNDINQILIALNAYMEQKIEPESSLLFLDEIQAAPEILSKLRWFAEDFTQLPVIAAGSLLEFVLADHSFSMPVGRISYIYIEPMSFNEFLLANQKEFFHDFINSYTLSIQIPDNVHEALMDLYKEYLIIGGMPAVVSSWIEEKSINRVNQIQNDILSTYRDDFAKYKGRIAVGKLDEVMMSVPKMLGHKFIFSHINPEIQLSTVKNVLQLLNKAKICYRVSGCSANGIPLAAELKEKLFKEIFLDVGLCNCALGLSLNQITNIDEITLINKGSIAEQIVGQTLRIITPPYIEPALYYWQREQKDSSAEIDYVIQHGNKVIPVEVKSGSTGSLKSLHFFMKLKNLAHAIRINSASPSLVDVDVKDHQSQQIRYKLLSLPFYLASQIPRLLDEVI